MVILPDPTIMAAWLAFGGLKAALPSDMLLGTMPINILSQPSSLTPTEAALHLSRLEKPIACAASIRDGTMVIQCEQLTRAQERLHAHRGTRDGLLWVSTSQQIDEHYDENCILVIAAGHELLVTPHAVEIFERDYLIVTEGNSIGLRRPNVAEASRGLMLVMSFGRVEPLSNDAMSRRVNRVIEDAQ